MAINEFIAYCDAIIKRELETKRKFKEDKYFRDEIISWVNDTRIELKRKFTEYSKKVENESIEELNKIIDMKVKYFIDRVI